MHGGTNPGGPIIHGLYSRKLRERPGFAAYLDAIEEQDASGATLTGELTAIRARLLEIQSTDPKPEWIALLAGAIARLAQTEERLRQLIPIADAMAGLREVMDVVRAVVDAGTWETIKARLDAACLGPVVDIAEGRVEFGRRADGARRLSAGPVAEELPGE